MRARGPEAEVGRMLEGKGEGSEDERHNSTSKTLLHRAWVAKMSKYLSLLGRVLSFHQYKLDPLLQLSVAFPPKQFGNPIMYRTIF